MSNKEILLRLFRFLSPYRGKLIVSMIAMVFVALLTGAQTYMVKDLLDKIFIEKNAFYLYTLTIAVVVVFGVKGIFYYSYNVLLE
ncbi:MAG: ABC transporter permease, partial [Desulfofustis sp.]|nr:ABC transporter permease [Desulfofustis sp.]